MNTHTVNGIEVPEVQPTLAYTPRELTPEEMHLEALWATGRTALSSLFELRRIKTEIQDCASAIRYDLLPALNRIADAPARKPSFWSFLQRWVNDRRWKKISEASTNVKQKMLDKLSQQTCDRWGGSK
jgi:hypothetical protein